MSVASRVAGWDRRLGRGSKWGGSTTTASGLGYSTSATPVGPMVEIYVDEAWMDISSDVRYADKINISGGRPNEASTTPPSSCRFTLNNANGLYSPRNPMSPLYRKIGRNTQVRVSVNQEGTVRYRFHGEIVAWPSDWDKTGNDVWVSVEAAGILRRLHQGDSPLHSTLYRGLTRETDNPVIAYWPMEDGAESTFLASAVAGGKTMQYIGVPNLATFTDFNCSEAIPTMGTALATGKVPAYTVTGETQVRFLMAIPAAGSTNGAVLCTINTTGTARRWELYYLTAGATVGLRAYDSDGALLQDSGALVFLDIKGELTRVSIELTQTGADVFTTVSILYLDTGLVNDTTTFTGMTVSRVSSITLTQAGNHPDVAIGHLSLQVQTTSSFDLLSQTQAYAGETSVTRIRRLAAEEGIAMRGIVGNNTSPAMGPQRVKTLVDLIQECVDTDMGLLSESRDRLGLEFRTRGSLEVQNVKLALSYTASDLFEVPVPVDDDALSQNDVTVKRDQGSSARTVLETGAMSVLDPPNGIGRYDVAPTISLDDDDQLADQAGWRLFAGTVDEPRYPRVTIHLKRSTFTASYDLTAAALTMRMGDRLTISDSPPQIPAGDISQIAQGFSEVIDQFEHIITFNCAPESPYEVGYLDSASLGRADTAGAELTAAVDSTATSLSVTTTSGPVWVDSATYASEFPFDVIVGGEVVTVTAITGTTSPQTFTVTRSVNGVVKSQLAGEDLRLLQPMIIAL